MDSSNLMTKAMIAEAVLPVAATGFCLRDHSDSTSAQDRPQEPMAPPPSQKALTEISSA
jgi:hypothetical protein